MIFDENEKREFYVFIKHYFLRKKHHLNQSNHENLVPAISLVKTSFSSFRFGHTNTSDAERSGGRVEVTTHETFDKISRYGV